MYILGLQIGHSSTASLINNEKIIGIISEERLSRKKCQFGFPFLSIKKLLDLGKIKGKDIKQVSIASNELNTSGKRIHKQIFSESLGENYNKLAKKHKYNILKTSQYLLKSLNIDAKINFYDHHLSHAASAYYTCELEDPLVITSDGYGDGLSTTVNLEKNGNLERIHHIEKYNSIGRFYSFITIIQGFKALRHEGKITGLAAYGDPEKLFKTFQRYISYNDKKNSFESKIVNEAINKKNRLRIKTLFKYITKQVTDFSWIDQYIISELKKDCKGYKKEDIAAAAQKLTEDLMIKYIKYWLKKTGKKNIILAGGLFANVKLNQFIHELKEVKNIYIHPGMGDEGLALGSSFLSLKEKKKSIKRKNLKNVYFGEEFSNQEILKILEKKNDIKYTKYSNKSLAKKVAKDLSDGKIIGLFTLRMEYGPRALGARTILADPRDKTINDWLNKRLHRTEFMPFAPVVLEEEAEKIFDNTKGAKYTSKFMTITFNVNKNWIKKIPAVTHIDNTARPQFIDKKTNLKYYLIIEEFYRITGIPLTINTSFNMHEEPIIDNPKNAIRSLKNGAIDYLVLENYIVEVKNK
jgi:carbamoyltransferase